MISGDKVGAEVRNDGFEDLKEKLDFEREAGNLNENEDSAESGEVVGGSDEVLERVFDKVGRGIGEGYFEDPDALLALTKDATSRKAQETIDNFRKQIDAYRSKVNMKYDIKARTLYELTRQNVQKLSKEHLVGNDTIKVFLDPDLVSWVGRGRVMSEYSTLQADYSRRDETNWMGGLQTYQRYQVRVKELADSFAKEGGDIRYQREIPDLDATYDPHKPVMPGDFLHVNANKPRDDGGLRCYITSDKTSDPSAVLYMWKESVMASPLKDSLYFKFATSIGYRDAQKQRMDDIVVYKTDNIDDQEFKNLLQDFRRRCNEASTELLPKDERKMLATTRKIANGISIAGEPSYVNDYLRYTDRKEGKHSWTTFIDKMTMLSISVAANRLGVRPTSMDAPGLEDETKKVFREFMLLSKINPDTMLPEEYGEKLPSWANLGE